MLKGGINKAKDFLKKSIKETLEAIKIADENIRSVIEQAIIGGTTKLSELKKIIREYLENKSGK